jgi:uncharacterized membrane protein YdbT with pleckstrin-like domain
MSSTPPPAGNDNSGAPTSPMGGGTAPMGSRQRWRQQVAQGSQRGRALRWGGRPAQQAYRGRGGTPRPVGPAFRGQMAGEIPVFVRRRHPIFLIVPAWPAVLSLLGLVVLLALHTSNVRLSALFFILETVLGAIFVIFLLKWLVIDLINWFFNLYVLTDRRLMSAEGFFTPRRKEATLDRIQQVQVDRSNLFEYLFDIGDVQIVTAGAQGDIALAGAAHPREVADQIREAEQAYRKGGRAAAAPVEPKHPAIKKVLDEMAQPIVVDQPAGVPQRTFGGFLRRPAMIHYLENEVVISYIYRHWFVLVRREVIPALILVASLLLGGALAAFLHTGLWLVSLVGVLVGILYGTLVYLNYADDVFILTTERIIDIDRFVFIFFEGRKQADYSKVQDVRVSVDSLIGRILNYGDITVETAGRLPNIEMSDIPNPFTVQDLIFARMNAVKERDAAAAANRQRSEYRRMIAATMNELLVEVPDVRQRSLLDAGAALQAAGLRLVVDSERRMRGVLPGVVVAQMPAPNSTVLQDSEVRVVLSGRA